MGHTTSACLTFVLIARVTSDGVASFEAYEEAVLPLLSEFGWIAEASAARNEFLAMTNVT
jgi:hypothetical protein